MASEVPKMFKHGTDGKRKHITLVMPQKLEINRELENGECRNVFMAAYNIGLPTVCNIKEDQL
jgi:hypothetical protein